MIKVYCDTSGFRQGLKDLQNQGKIELVMFSYENKNRNITNSGKPSAATIGDLKNFTIGALPGTIGDYKGSNRFESLKEIMGEENRVDILHLDSAFKTGCLFFLTRDRKHIVSKREEIEKILGIKVVHSDDDWEKFNSYLK